MRAYNTACTIIRQSTDCIYKPQFMRNFDMYKRNNIMDHTASSNLNLCRKFIARDVKFSRCCIAYGSPEDVYLGIIESSVLF